MSTPMPDLIERQCRTTVATPMSDISRTIPRAALVTGGAQRIGRTIAIALAEAGFDVAVHCNASREAGAETCERIRRLGRRATLLPADLMHEEQTQRLLPQA